MTEENQQELAVVAAAFRMPRYRELPDFGLRLEQVTRYASRYVPAPLTGSMVSNYVKQRLIPAPKKKAYSRESIAYLLVLSYVKTVMSMEDVRLMEQVQQGSYELSVAYDYFCEELENLVQYVFGLKSAPDEIGTTHTREKALLRAALLSVTHKLYMERHLKFMRAEQLPPEENKPGV